jgi:hypothetical protein
LSLFFRDLYCVCSQLYARNVTAPRDWFFRFCFYSWLISTHPLFLYIWLQTGNVNLYHMNTATVYTSSSRNRTAGEDHFGLSLNSVFIRGLAGERENFILKDFLFSKHPTCKLFYKKGLEILFYTSQNYIQKTAALKSKVSKMKRCYNLITKKNLFMQEFWSSLPVRFHTQLRLNLLTGK